MNPRLSSIYTADGTPPASLTFTVFHHPPGTSKSNRIEHKMFSFITMNWRGKPLTSLRTIIELISSTTTATGLRGQAGYDPNCYPKGVKVSDAELATIALAPHEFHGEWNCTVTAQSNTA